jgi:phosphoserine aminotransferase
MVRGVRSDVVNFSAGPAGLPTPALERAQAELLDYQGTGASIMELSHRGRHYDEVHHQALAGVRELLAVPDTHEVLFLQGGATGMFGLVPLNFLSDGGSADFVMTGTWSDKALAEARLVGQARVAGTGETDGAYTSIPTALDLDPGAVYVHITSNNTVVGTQFARFPDTGAVPLVADMSSDIMSRPIDDWSRFGLVYAGAQKNLGPSGVVIVIAAKAMLERCSKRIPKIFRFSSHAEKASLLHTPPTFAIYLVRNVLDWIRSEGGVAEMARRNEEKARRVYAAIDGSAGFYRCPVQREARSQMNVVFRLPTEALERAFLDEAETAGLIGLKGHRSVGGIRASLYNAVSVEGVDRLLEHMRRFAEAHR